MANKGSSLTNGQYLKGDDYLVSDNGKYIAYMQDDGNFVLFFATTSVPVGPDWKRFFWASNTGGRSGSSFAIMQDDGNFVLYLGSDPQHSGAPYWASNTNKGSGQYTLIMQNDGNLVLYRQGTALWASNTTWVASRVTARSSLQNGQFLGNSDYLISDNGQYFAVMQGDGNFVLYHATATVPPTPDGKRPFWASNTSHSGSSFAIMQDDGNFVLYLGSDPQHSGAPYWASNTNKGSGQYTLIMQNDGNLVLYRQGTALWASNTVQASPPTPVSQPAATGQTSAARQPVATSQPAVSPPTPASQPAATSQTGTAAQTASQPVSATLSTSSQFMQNFMAARAYSAEHPIFAVQDSNGDPLIFSIGSDGEFHVILRAPQSLTGWQQIDLSSALGAGRVAQTFAVTQDATGNITLALALSVSGQADASQLYLTAPFSNNPALTDWITVSKQWMSRPFDQGAITIDEILMLPGNDDNSTLSLIVATRQQGKDAAHWLVNGDVKATSSLWTSYALPTNAQYMLDMAIGNHPLGPGVYALYLNGSARVLEFTTFDGSFNIGLTAPANATKLTLLPGDQNTTDLYVAGDGLYYFPVDNQTAEAQGVVIASAQDFSGTQDVVVRQDANTIAIWGRTSNGNLLYLTGNKGDQVTWSLPVVLRKNVAQIAPLRNRVRMTNELLYVGFDNTTLAHLRQDPATSLWKETDIPLFDSGATIEFTSYETRISLKDQDNLPVTTGEVAITASQWTYVMINGLEYAVDSQHPVSVQPDGQGAITLTQKITTLVTPLYHVSASFLAQAVDIDPAADVKSSLAKVQNGDDLLSQKRQNGDSVLKGNVDQPTRDAAAQAIQNLTSLNPKATSSPTSVPSVGSPSAAWGIQMGGSVAVMSTTTAASAQPSNIHHGLIGDLIEWFRQGLAKIESVTVQVWDEVSHVFIDLGNRIWHCVIETVEQVMQALDWLLSELLNLVLKDLLEWLGFLFGWDDILNTHTVLRKLIEVTYDHLVSNVDKFEGQIKDTFQLIREKLIGQSLGADSSNDIFNSSPLKVSHGQDTSQSHMDTPHGNWILNAFLNHIHLVSYEPSSSSNPSSPASTGTGTVADTVLNSLTTETQVVQNAVQEVITDVLDRLDQLSFAEILEKLALIIGEALINSAENMALSFVQIAELLGSAVWDLLTTRITIPLITPLYEKIIAPGSQLTMLDLACLVVAIPSTIVFKVFTHAAPFAASEAQALANVKRFEDFVQLVAGTPLPSSTTFKAMENETLLRVQQACGLGMVVTQLFSALVGYYVDSKTLDAGGIDSYSVPGYTPGITGMADAWNVDRKYRRIKAAIDCGTYLLCCANASLAMATTTDMPTSQRLGIALQLGQLLIVFRDVFIAYKLVDPAASGNSAYAVGANAGLIKGVSGIGLVSGVMNLALASAATFEEDEENKKAGIPQGIGDPAARNLGLKAGATFAVCIVQLSYTIRKVYIEDPIRKKVLRVIELVLNLANVGMTGARVGYNFNDKDQQYLDAGLHVVGV